MSIHKINFDLLRRARVWNVRRIFDEKLSYRKLFVIIIISCLLFLWLLTRFIFGGNEKKKSGTEAFLPMFTCLISKMKTRKFRVFVILINQYILDICIKIMKFFRVFWILHR